MVNADPLKQHASSISVNNALDASKMSLQPPLKTK